MSPFGVCPLLVSIYNVAPLIPIYEQQVISYRHRQKQSLSQWVTGVNHVHCVCVCLVWLVHLVYLVDLFYFVGLADWVLLD